MDGGGADVAGGCSGACSNNTRDGCIHSLTLGATAQQIDSTQSAQLLHEHRRSITATVCLPSTGVTAMHDVTALCLPCRCHVIALLYLAGISYDVTAR